MIEKHIRHFGKAVSCIVYALIVLIMFAGINLSNFTNLGDVAIAYFIAFLLAFFVSVFIFYPKKKAIFNILFFLVILISQAYVISGFYRSVELSDVHESPYEKNAALGLAWVFAIPFGLIVVFIIGLVFDIIKNRAHLRKHD